MSSRIWLRRWTIWRVLRDDQPQSALPVSSVYFSSGVLDEVIRGGRLRDAGQEGVLGQREVLEVLLPVALGGRGHAVAPVAVEVVVEVRLHDQLLAFPAGIGLGQPDRLDDLAELPLVAVDALVHELFGQEPASNQLLGDRGAAAVVALQRVDGRGDEASRIEAGVLPERLVLDRRRGVDEDGRDLVEASPPRGGRTRGEPAGPRRSGRRRPSAGRTRSPPGPAWGPGGPSRGTSSRRPPWSRPRRQAGRWW